MSHFQSGVALRSIAEFKCLGSDCEITCCSGWRIPLSQSDIEGLEAAVSFSPEASATFDRVVKKGVELPVLGTCGELTMGDDGLCAFLDSDQLCSVHAAKGHEAIPTICALFPRRFAVIGDRIEMTPLVSCPEAARLLLLHPNGIELVDLDPELHPRLIANHIVAAASTEAYERYIDDVRATLLSILDQRSVPVGARLFFISALAQRVDDFFGRGVAGFEESRLSDALREISDAENLSKLWDEFEALEIPPLFGASVVYQLLAPLAATSAKLGALLTRALESYGSEAQLAEEYTTRSAFFEHHLGDRLDLAFTNLAANYWMQSYLDTDSLLLGLRSLVVQIQAVRLLILGDPELDQARIDFESGRLDHPGLSTALDEALVRVIFQFARGTEHDPDFWRLIHQGLDEAGHTSWAQIVGMIPRYTGSTVPDLQVS